MMQTIQFNCPHCGNPMAVALNLLGRNVRCPHCREVVQAPANDPTPVAPRPQAEIPQFVRREEHESIFGENHDEDVFGSRPVKNPVMLPPNMPFSPTADTQQTTGPSAFLQPQQTLNPAESMVSLPTIPTSLTSIPGTPDAVTEITAPSSAHVPAPDPEPLVSQDDFTALEDFSPAIQPPPPEIPQDNEQPVRAAKRNKEGNGGSGNLFIGLLLLYAAVATAGAAILYFRSTKANGPEKQDPWWAIPDVLGEYEKANRSKPTSFRWMPKENDPLGPSQKLALKQRKSFGNLEVEPKMVEYRTVRVHRRFSDGRPPKDEESGGKTLLLTLKVKNISSDVWFHPNDPAFNRQFRTNATGVKPFNSLRLGNNTDYGGIFPWPRDPLLEANWIEGQEKDSQPLGPGEERETTICTLPGADLPKLLLKDPQKPAIWHVQLRRGLVTEGTNTISATTVIGVEFAGRDVIE